MVQGGGAGLIVSTDTRMQAIGVDLLLIGLCFQLVFFATFTVSVRQRLGVRPSAVRMALGSAGRCFGFLWPLFTMRNVF